MNVKLDYISSLLLKPHDWEKSVGRDILAQSWQSRLFLHFLSFTNITVEIFI